MKIVIVGGVAGGATAAARMRRITEDAQIVLFERGDYISYANCGLPYYIGGVISDRDNLFVMTPEEFGERFNIEIRTRSEVTSVDTAKKVVKVQGPDGKEYEESYDKLLLSPGAAPVRPPLPGIDSEGIFTLRNVNDTDHIKDYIKSHNVKQAVIVGAGFIGLEMAENLKHLGIDVSVVEMANQVMGPIDYSMAGYVHQQLVQKGVNLYLEQAVESFEKQGDDLKVNFKSGIQATAQLVILSIGVRAETKLAQDAGLKIGEMRGIYVNEYLQTSDENVYAVGDAIEYPHPITGKPWLNFLAGPANRQARLVADNIIFGNKLKYEGAIGTAIAKVFNLTVATTGLPGKRLKMFGIPYKSATIHPYSNASYYPGATPLHIKITFNPDNGQLYGAQIVGQDGVDKRIDQFAQVIKHKGTIYDLMELEHAYAPPFSSAKDPVAMAGYVAYNILTNKMPPCYWRDLVEAKEGEYTLIDVRTTDEYAIDHLEGSINIPVDGMREHLNEIDRSKPIVVYCGVGLRGYLASNLLIANGFKDVRNLVGGLLALHAATYKVPTPSQNSTNSAPRNLAQSCCSSGTCGMASNSSSNSAVAQGSNMAQQVNIVQKIDATGLQCPGPIMRLKKGIEGLEDGQALEIRASDPGFPRDSQAWCNTTGNTFVSSVEDNGVFTVVVGKGAVAGALVPTGSEVATSVAPRDMGKTFIMFSDDLDKVLATFVLANGAAATGKKVTIFFTFWGLNAIKKINKPAVTKDIFGTMFGMMLPSHSEKLKLSKMHMAGMGTSMMRYIMNKKGIDSLESLRQQAIDNGVEFIACQMSMDVMGVKKEELLDNVTIGGVATYMERAENANINLFI